MKIFIENTYDQMSRKVCDNIISYIKNKPKSLICLAGGDTPLKTFEYLIQANLNDEVDFSQTTFVSLDEWVGLGKETKGSCIYTLYKNLYEKLNIDLEKQVHFFDGLSKDLKNECKKINHLIEKFDGLDISLLGIGLNGHLGFNEPNVDENIDCGIIELDNTTKTVGQKYFDTNLDLKYGITIGLKHLLNSKRLILIANGEKKAEIVEKTLYGEISNNVPSSLARKKPNFFIYLDRLASKNIINKNNI